MTQGLSVFDGFMKNVIIASGLVLIIILTAVISLTVYSHNTRQNEVEEALAVAVEQALENLKISPEYPVQNEKEFLADFVQRLVLGLNSDSDITVNILAVDYEKGLLDVEVVETYQQLIGKRGTASYRKTVILDEIYADVAELHTVTFWMEKADGSGEFEKYKTFTITHGCSVIFPGADPVLDGFVFDGWSSSQPAASNGYSPELVNEDVPIEVTGDMEFYAVFH